MCAVMSLYEASRVRKTAPNSPGLVDASYIMFGFHSHESGLRRLMRGTNRALWLRARAALTSRNKDGFFVRFRTCSSHGKDSKQHQLISLWNNRADTKAKLGCKTRQGDMHEWVPDGDFSFRLCIVGNQFEVTPGNTLGKPFNGNTLSTQPRSRMRGFYLPWYKSAQVGFPSARFSVTAPRYSSLGGANCPSFPSPSAYRGSRFPLHLGFT